MTATTLLPFLLTSLMVELVPGPNMAYLALLGLSRGFSVGLAAVAGVALGLTLIGAATLLGLGPLVAGQPVLMQAMQWLGVGFFFWLAFDAWREGNRPIGAIDANRPLPVYFRRGLITNLLNPKAFVFFLVVVPEFVVPSAPPWPQLTLLLAVYVAVATIVHTAVVGLGGTAQRYLVRPEWRRRLAGFSALALAVVALWFTWETLSHIPRR